MVDVPVNDQVPSIVVDVVTNGQTIFDYDFRADDVGDLRAQYRPATGANIDMVGGVDFVASGLGTANGGTINLVTFTATLAGAKLAMFRQIPIERTTDYTRDLFADDLNQEQDQTYMIMQQLQRDVARSMKVEIGETPPDITFLVEQIAIAIAAAAAAVGAANSKFIFPTYADFIAASIPSAAKTVTIAGYYAAGDLGEHTRHLVEDGSIVAGDVVSMGKRWRFSEENELRPECFGAIPLLASRLVEINGSMATLSPIIAANDAAFVLAREVGRARSGDTIKAKGNIYVLSVGLRFPDGCGIEGSGTGIWEPVDRSRPKKWNGTNFVFKGTGAKDVTIAGISSLYLQGGRQSDSGNNFDLTSFTNQDMAGVVPATLRPLSVAMMNEVGAHAIRLTGFRSVNWIGTDGISDWSSTVTTSLGDEWSVGLLHMESENNYTFDVQVVGAWRDFGQLQLSHGMLGTGRSERNYYANCRFQGRIGRGLRGPDRYRLTAVTANTVTVLAGVDFPFPAAGTFRIGFLSGTTLYTYTGVSRSGNNVSFTGVTPDPSGQALGSVVRPPGSGLGFAGTEYHNCYAYSLYHQSGQDAAALGLGTSKAIEISGYPMRGVQEYNSKFHSRDQVIIQAHDCSDWLMIGPQPEGSGYIIATTLNGGLGNGMGETRNMRAINAAGFAAANLALFNFRTGIIDELQLAYRDDTDINQAMTMKAFMSRNLELITAGGKVVMSGASGAMYPLDDNAKSLGTIGNRWARLFTEIITMNGISILTGSGIPEGVVTAPVNSLYLNITAGGPATWMYRKNTGSGNTGWVAATN